MATVAQAALLAVPVLRVPQAQVVHWALVDRQVQPVMPEQLALSEPEASQVESAQVAPVVLQVLVVPRVTQVQVVLAEPVVPVVSAEPVVM